MLVLKLAHKKIVLLDHEIILIIIILLQLLLMNGSTFPQNTALKLKVTKLFPENY